MEKKVLTRRAAIGAGITVMVAAPLIIRALRDVYEVDIPAGMRPVTLGGKTVTQYEGIEIEIEVPKMAIETPEDEEKFKELVMEEVKKTPQFAEVNRKKLQDAKAQGRQQVLDEYAELEKDIRQRIANATDLSESEKVALQKKALADLQASKEAALKQIDDITIPADL
ncbi:MAG: hypothetical protein EA424_05375 [Planctomycetaceae bacterium]|nr:MAG: hypothetical protein EA424_05375 [Planctomycetaceae bacterium]